MMYMLKLRFKAQFGSRAGGCWRLLFTSALMPWLVNYKVDRLPKGALRSLWQTPTDMFDDDTKVNVDTIRGKSQRTLLETPWNYYERGDADADSRSGDGTITYSPDDKRRSTKETSGTPLVRDDADAGSGVDTIRGKSQSKLLEAPWNYYETGDADADSRSGDGTTTYSPDDKRRSTKETSGAPFVRDDADASSAGYYSAEEEEIDSSLDELPTTKGTMRSSDSTDVIQNHRLESDAIPAVQSGSPLSTDRRRLGEEAAALYDQLDS